MEPKTTESNLSKAVPEQFQTSFRAVSEQLTIS